MIEMSYPAKPKPGDRVAVVSPSSGLPGLFPEVYELGLRRLRDELGLTPVEYPTTRVMNSDPRDRARDLNAAFADPSITAVLATIGGDDQLTVIPYLDRDAFVSRPKPFFGFSDNTNLLNYLFNLGIVGYHGSSVMVHLGRGGRLHPESTDSLRAALFGSGWHELAAADTFSDEGRNWAQPESLELEPPTRPGGGWTWDVPDSAPTLIEGELWGGCLEVLAWIMEVDRVAPPARFAGGVLMIETSEQLPPATEVHRVLRSMGERGILGEIRALLVGRPKAWEFDQPLSIEQRTGFAAEQRAAIRRAVMSYNMDLVVVFDLDIGHTDPQLIMPIGGAVRIDIPAGRISVRY